jgi:putative membrane protein
MSRISTIGTAVIAAALCVGVAYAEENQPASGTSNNTSMQTQNSSSMTNPSGTTAANTSQAKLSDKEEDFIKDAAQGGKAEVAVNQEVAQKATNQNVKQVATKIAQDHQNANQQLMQLAQQKGVQLPAKLKDNQKDLQEKLGKLEGQKLDKEYADAMVKDHEKDIKKFEEMAKDAKDPQVKAFAQQTLPVLRQHLDYVKAIQEGRQASISSTGGYTPTANYSVTNQNSAKTGTSPNSTGNMSGPGSTNQSGSTNPNPSTQPGTSPSNM